MNKRIVRTKLENAINGLDLILPNEFSVQKIRNQSKFKCVVESEGPAGNLHIQSLITGAVTNSILTTIFGKALTAEGFKSIEITGGFLNSALFFNVEI